MVRSTMGTQYLEESDLIDIVKQHFYRYGQGFKQVRTRVDLIQRDQPRIAMEIDLVPLNSAVPDKRIEKIYYNLLETCKESTDAEKEIFKKLYDMVKKGGIDKETFCGLVKRFKG
jgi:hypothetical protein